jgi:hypothetical protein
VTDAELKELVASLAVSQKETDRQLRETKQLQKETERLQKETVQIQKELAEQLKETDRQMKETDQRMKERDHHTQETERLRREADVRFEKKMAHISEMIGGIGNNNGAFAEDLFIAALEKKPQIGKIKFDSLHGHLRGVSRKGIEYEYDILLQNGAYIGLVEVKYRLHPDAVAKFAMEALPRFKEVFPQFADKKLIGAVASTSIPQGAIDKAREHGLAVLSQEGQEIRVLSDDVREY